MDAELGKRLIKLRERISERFQFVNWEELGLLTDASILIDSHPRLLRSLGFGDDDYPANVLAVLRQMVEEDMHRLSVIEAYVDEHFPDNETYISAKPAERHITFSPYVFQVPDGYAEPDLVAVMMPFSMEFDGVYAAIKKAASDCEFRCLRADDIWEESTIVQDIFNLMFRAQVIVVDFTGKNPNVMYETGIAHVLGKYVIPISQSLEDVPFDIRHHRVLKYLPNTEGLNKLASGLAVKLRNIRPRAQVLTRTEKVRTLSEDDPELKHHSPAPLGKATIRLTFSEQGLVNDNNEELKASLEEALFAQDNKQEIEFDVVLEPLELVKEYISQAEKAEASPENRIISVKLRRNAKHLEAKKGLIELAIQMLLSPSLRFLFPDSRELIMSLNGLARSAFGIRADWAYALDVYRKAPDIRTVIYLDENEIEKLEDQLGHSITLLIGSGWDLYDLPGTIRLEKAIPAIVLEVARGSLELGEVTNTLLNLNKWSIGLH